MQERRELGGRLGAADFGHDVRRRAHAGAVAWATVPLALASCSARSLELFPDNDRVSDASSAAAERDGMRGSDVGNLRPDSGGTADSSDAMCPCSTGGSCTACVDEQQCAAEQLHCDLQSHRCVECTMDIDCVVPGERCHPVTHECGTPCSANVPCGAGEACDLGIAICVACIGNACANGQSQVMQGNCGP